MLEQIIVVLLRSKTSHIILFVHFRICQIKIFIMCEEEVEGSASQCFQPKKCYQLQKVEEDINLKSEMYLGSLRSLYYNTSRLIKIHQSLVICSSEQ